jgi:hypothetical protein
MKQDWCLLPFVCMLLFVFDLASLNLSQLKKTESLTKLKKKKERKKSRPLDYTNQPVHRFLPILRRFTHFFPDLFAIQF